MNKFPKRIWGPSDAICESCQQTELLLRTVVFADGESFKVCGRCAEEAHRLCVEVFS